VPEVALLDFQTRLAVAMDATQTYIRVEDPAPATGRVTGALFRSRVEDEWMIVTDASDVVPDATDGWYQWTVERGRETDGGPAVAHTLLDGDSNPRAVDAVLTPEAARALTSLVIPMPSSRGYRGWTGDPDETFDVDSYTATTEKDDRVFWSRLIMETKGPITKVCTRIVGAGSGYTGNNGVGVYNAAGTLIAKSADTASIFNSTGDKELTLTVESGQSLDIQDDYIWIGDLFNGTTGHQAVQHPYGTGGWNVPLGGVRAMRSNYSLGSPPALPASLTSGGTNINVANRLWWAVK